MALDPDVYWNRYVKAAGLDPDERYAGDFSFESHGFTGDEQLALVLSGKKTGVFSSYATYGIDNEPLPVSGEYYIVNDRSEEPRCIIEVTDVSVVPFNEVTWDMAGQEGEDENLAAWHDKQTEYLKDEADIVGFTFTPDIRLVFMSFRVVYR